VGTIHLVEYHPRKLGSIQEHFLTKLAHGQVISCLRTCRIGVASFFLSGQLIGKFVRMPL